jgi:hypothetical protein
MRTFDPKCEVRLIKARARSEIVTGKQAAASRYGSNFSGMDLTPYLSEYGSVNVRKSVREAAGGFSITLNDRPNVQLGESLYALIEPMDIIEIRMARSPSEYQNSTASSSQYNTLMAQANTLKAQGDAADAAGDSAAATEYWRASLSASTRAVQSGEGSKTTYKLPIVMRGFVTRVGRGQSIESGVPQRQITITGQDYGKLLQIIRIFYNTFNGGYVADDIISGLKFFHQYASDGAAKIKNARDFVNEVLAGIINPYLANLAPLQTPQELDVTLVKQFTAAVSIESLVSPLSIAGYSEGAIYDFLASMLDVGPFNELYTEDTEDGVNLILRPVPFKDYATGQFLDANAWADSLVLPMGVVQSMELSRSDENVANFYWVTNSRWQLIDNSTQRMAANQGSPDSFYKKDYVNSQLSIFGIRKMQAEVSMAPPNAVSPDSATADQAAAESATYLSWLADRRTFLANANKDNVVLESGTIKVRGNEQIKAGMYVTVQTFQTDNDIQPAGEYYVTSVTQEFIPFIGFFTTMQVERGTNFANRTQSQGTPYYDELDLGGIS